MKLSVAQDTMRELIATFSSTGTWDDSRLTAFLNMAQRLILRRVWKRNPAMCYDERQVTYTAGATSVAIYSSNPPEAVMAAYLMQGAGTMGINNFPTVIEPMNAVDLEMLNADPAYNTDWDGYRWAFDGNGNVLLRPLPPQDEHLIMRCLFTPTDMSVATDDILGGRLPHLHDVIVLHATRLALVSDRGANKELQRLEQEAWMDATALMRSSWQLPPEVRNVTIHD